jgi:hypothetical protein
VRPEIDPASRAWITGCADRRWDEFLRCWESLYAKHARLPRRQEFDPLDLSLPIWPHLYLVDVVRGAEDSQPRFRMRLLGGRVVEIERTRRGQYLDELMAAPRYEAAVQQYRDCLEGRIAIRKSSLEWEDAYKRHIAYHVLLLPFSDDGARVDHLLGMVIYEFTASDTEPER